LDRRIRGIHLLFIVGVRADCKFTKVYADLLEFRGDIAHVGKRDKVVVIHPGIPFVKLQHTDNANHADGDGKNDNNKEAYDQLQINFKVFHNSTSLQYYVLMKSSHLTHGRPWCANKLQGRAAEDDRPCKTLFRKEGGRRRRTGVLTQWQFCRPEICGGGGGAGDS
jgi:hypothetical protein